MEMLTLALFHCAHEQARENVPPGQPVSDRLSSLAHSTSLLIAERLIGLNVIKQVRITINPKS